MLADFFKKHGWRYIPGVVFLCINGWIQMRSPKILGEIIDLMRASPIDTAAVTLGVWRLLIVGVGIFITRYIWRYFIMGNSRNLETFARQRLFTHLQHMSVHFYNHQKTGDLMAYAINDIGAIRMTFGPGLAMSVNGLFLGGMSVANMVGSIHPRLALFALLPVPIIIAVVMLMGTQIRMRFRRVQEVFAAVSDRVQENISGLRVIKAYVQEDAEVERFEKLNQEARKANLDMVRISASMGPVVSLLFGVSFTISLIYGSSLVRAGIITLGDFVAFNGYLALIVRPVQSVARIINVLQRGIASLKRYNAILEVPPMITDGEGEVPKHANPADIRVEDLSFSYPGTPQKALSHISFHLKPGQMLGILGRTGSGKTTLVNLLVKLYNVPDGRIFVGGADINHYSLDQLREGIGYVPQDNFLFSSSIEQNIRFFGEGYSQGQVLAAAQQAMIYDSIMEFPEAFDTQVGERGMSLSGGQKQRICIARALIKKPPLLILDDSLSAVDTRTEAGILQNLREQTQRGGSAILIAHRVSALSACDEILVLDQGRIAERGTHDQLMALKGMYAAIAHDQMLPDENGSGEGDEHV